MEKLLIVVVLSFISLNVMSQTDTDIINKVFELSNSSESLHESDLDAIDITTGDPIAIGLKCLFLTEYDRLDEALDIFESNSEVINNAKGNTYIKLAQGVITWAQDGDPLPYFLEAMEKDTLNQNIWLRLKLYDYYIESDAKMAEKYLDEALSIQPCYIPSLILKSGVFIESDDKKGEIRYLEKVEKKCPESIYMKNTLGYCYYNLAQNKIALDYFQKSNALKENADAFLGIGLITQDQPGFSIDGIDYILKCIELDPENELALIVLGWHFYSIGKYDIASEYFGQLIEIKDIVPYDYSNAFLFYVYVNDMEQVQKVLEALEQGYAEGPQYAACRLVLDIVERKLTNEQISIRVKEYQKIFSKDDIDWINKFLDLLLNKSVPEML